MIDKQIITFKKYREGLNKLLGAMVIRIKSGSVVTRRKLPGTRRALRLNPNKVSKRLNS